MKGTDHGVLFKVFAAIYGAVIAIIWIKPAKDAKERKTETGTGTSYI